MENNSFEANTASQGVMLTPTYHNNAQDVVGVPVDEIRDASSSAKEEVIQLSAGGFFFSGAFWLGFERLFTEGVSDTLFIICVIAAIAGGITGIMGYRQTTRRLTRLERYVPPDKV